MRHKLSICIPTFNRCRELAELLDSIAAQDSQELEVIVSDDASTEDIEAVVGKYKGKIQQLRFYRNSRNLGLDQNFFQSANQAEGEYIWFMGDDDRLEPGAIDRVQEALSMWPEVPGLTLGVIDYDCSLNLRTGLRQMPETQKISTAEDLFAKAVEHLGFMSALVVDRAKWQEVAQEGDTLNYQNYYVQVFIIGQIAKRHKGWGILNEPCVGFRSDNDQYLKRHGWLYRLRIDAEAYEQIAVGLFGSNSPCRRVIRRRILKTHILSRLRNARLRSDSTTPRELYELLFVYYNRVPEFWYSAVPTIFAPRILLITIRSIYRRVSQNAGSARVRRLRS